MSRIQVRNLQRKWVDKEFLEKVGFKALGGNLRYKNKEISIAIVDIKKMVELNEKFRGVKRPTDVLAFPLGGEFISTENLLGEVVISMDEAEEQAREEGHFLKDELALLIVHGILHLLGYTDKDEGKREVMRNKEKRILQSLGIKMNPVREFFSNGVNSERREINGRRKK